MQTLTPFLWFDGQAEEAAKHYTAIFKNSKILSVSPMDARIEVNGQRLYLFNGGPMFKFNCAISMFIECEDQAEVDYLWEKLCEGGAPNRCGWLTDKFGLSWQIIPKKLSELLSHNDREKAGRAMQAMLKMSKIDQAALQSAFDGDG
jgi:predicted 3-demethylubiquinone-9 3-methyltransferase (glyoxalase superfamily)